MPKRGEPRINRVKHAEAMLAVREKIRSEKLKCLQILLRITSKT